MRPLKLLLLLLLVHSCLLADENSDKSAAKTEERTISQQINQRFTPFVETLSEVLFWDPLHAVGLYDQQVYDKSGNAVIDATGAPVKAPLKLIVLWLMAGGLFFTFYLRFINIRAFRHAIGLVSGKHDVLGSKGEVSHFQALTTALSATVGLGNIAGVAVAISIGGPGATIWMIMAGFLGMSLKFSECTLGLKYRKINALGEVSGGAMYYLRDGLAKKGLAPLGIALAVLFSIMAIGGSVGGGNMLQANQAFEQLAIFFPKVSGYGFWYGLLMAFFVGLVIIGGIKSIARVTSRIVPLMALIYVTASLVIILLNIDQTGHALRLIWDGAFNSDALKGGVVGVLIFGFQRGAFSNEAGVGSASIAHAAARTEEPVSEGIVALLEPFVDTVIICTMTALVIIFSGVYQDTSGIQGVSLTSAAYGSVISWFPYVLLVAVSLFAFSTMISWSYYGLKSFDFLFGSWSQRYFGSRKPTNTIFNSFFLLCIVIGSAASLGPVMDFSDMMVLCMAFPNLLGLFLLAPEVKKDLKIYWKKRLKKTPDA
ncbi:MAG: alanine:cation symporter family protein [Bacteroidetes bacterium]|nr:alanine:cation symporter family protein [Bacteroidota bacterium]MBU1580215.1 alanine:cation symporter family protein [Bacteroidota bacterium]MBU2557710.1 alanine:cation symporter family protein [Bacteroidota bacterium]